MADALDFLKAPKIPKLSRRFPVDELALGDTYDEKQLKKFVRGDTQAKLDLIQEYEDRSIAESALEVIQNAGGEIKDIVLGLPILFGKGAKKAITAAFNPTDTLESITSGEAWEDFKDVFTHLKDTVSDDYVNRWGPLFEGDFETFAKRTKEKPISFLLDVGGAMSLIGGAAKAGGAALAKEVATQGLNATGTAVGGRLITPLAQGRNALEKAGLAMSNVGNVLDPFQLAKAGVRQAGEIVPREFPILGPLISKDAQFERMRAKMGMNVTLEEAARIRQGYWKKAADGSRTYIKGLDAWMDDWSKAVEPLTADELRNLPIDLSGLDTIPLSNQSEAYRKAKSLATEFFNDERNIDIFGLTSETAKRRRLMPVVQRYLREGKLQLNEAQIDELMKAGHLSHNPLDNKLDLSAKTKIEDLPSYLFDDDFLLPVQDAADKAVYVPLLDAEHGLDSASFFGRITKGVDRPKSQFEKSFAGDMSLKFLKTKDPGVFADIREVGRQYLVERGNAELTNQVGERLLKAIDPVTGKRQAKRIYMGKVPEHAAGFQRGEDLAEVLNAMEKPFVANTVDDVYKKVFGPNSTFDEQLKLTRHNNPRMSISEAKALNEKAIFEKLSAEGYDGVWSKTGEFSVFDQMKHPFPQLLPGHVVFSPKQTARLNKMQSQIAEKVTEGMDAGMTMEAAQAKAVGALFPDKETLYKYITEDMAERQKAGFAFMNDNLLEPQARADFRAELQAGLKESLKGKLDFDDAAIEGAVKRNSTAASKKARKLSGESVNELNWAYQIPKETADAVIQTVRPNTNVPTFIKTYWDSPLQLWRSLVLNYSGRWHVNNFFGNMMLNVMSGTLNPTDYMKAGRLFQHRLIDRFTRAGGTPRAVMQKAFGFTDEALDTARAHASVMPPELAMGTFAKVENQPLSQAAAALSNTGKIQAGILASKPVRAFQKGAAASAEFNSLVDQFFRDAQFFKLARQEMRKESKGLLKKAMLSFYASDDAVYNFVERMNSETATQMVDKISEFLPNYMKLLGPTERVWARRIMPFYSWYKHITRTAFLMPLKHPKRTALIGAIGRLGDTLNNEELRAAGIDPNDAKLVARWLKGTIIAGKGETGPKFLNLKAINPLSTLAEITNLGNALDPRLQIAIERMTGVDLFTQKPIPKKVVMGDDGVPREVSARTFVDDIIGATPITEFIRRVANPTVESVDGEVLFRRDRIDETLKMLGINLNEQDIAKIKDKAERKRGELAGKALRQLVGQKRKEPGAVGEMLDFIMKREK